MFEKYLNLIKSHTDNKNKIKLFLDEKGLSKIDFNIDGNEVFFNIPSAFKLRIHQKRLEIINFLKTLNLKSKNL